MTDEFAGSGQPSSEAEAYWADLPSNSLAAPDVLNARFPVIDFTPQVEGGRRAVKASVGELITIECTAFREGHDALGVNLVAVAPDGRRQPWNRMVLIERGLDLWRTEFRPDQTGMWHLTVEAWSDPYGTWEHRATVKIPAEVDVELERASGSAVLRRAAAGIPDSAEATDASGVSGASQADAQAARDVLLSAAAMLDDLTIAAEDALKAATSEAVHEALERFPLRDLVSPCGPWPFWVDRQRALFSSWYELFPRSEGASLDPPRSGTLAEAAKRLPAIAEAGFDVVYLPPIHPIGEVNRKGPNNTLDPGAEDPGSPWAIGSAAGGHDALHPDLGTLDDFDAFVAATQALGMEVALDFALQAAPDHPWVAEDRDFFTVRADGTIAYAENPPKKYQDIYPISFDQDPADLYAEVLRVLRFWMDRGVRIFRVDNPHTKPVRFWDQLLTEIRSTDPDVLFLSEAFTRPPMMRALAEVGFHQSYTYFTWRNEAWEIQDYLRELSGTAAAYMRPNFWPNTPDILPAFLQHGGRSAFAIRATLAATSSPNWGIYSGFELYENAAVRPGAEEYLDSEKYQYRPRDWDAIAASGDSLMPYIGRLNQLRSEHRALQQLRNLTLHHVDSDRMLAFSKRDGDDVVLVVMTLDPFGPQESFVRLDLPALGLEWHDQFTADDLITGQRFVWGQQNYVRLDPTQAVAHVLAVRSGVV